MHFHFYIPHSNCESLTKMPFFLFILSLTSLLSQATSMATVSISTTKAIVVPRLSPFIYNSLFCYPSPPLFNTTLPKVPK